MEAMRIVLPIRPMEENTSLKPRRLTENSAIVGKNQTFQNGCKSVSALLHHWPNPGVFTFSEMVWIQKGDWLRSLHSKGKKIRWGPG